MLATSAESSSNRGVFRSWPSVDRNTLNRPGVMVGSMLSAAVSLASSVSSCDWDPEASCEAGRDEAKEVCDCDDAAPFVPFGRLRWVVVRGEAVYKSSSSESTSSPVPPFVRGLDPFIPPLRPRVRPLVRAVPGVLVRDVPALLVGGGESESESELSFPDDSSSSGRVLRRLLFFSSSTTSLNSAKRRIASAARASCSSTRFERRDLACAVARRIMVSRVRTVIGLVFRWLPSMSSFLSPT